MDHLPLPGPQVLDSRRARGNPTPERIVRRFEHGADLTIVLDTFTAQIPPERAETEEDDARIVLKFRGTTRLASGPFARLRFTPLGEGEDWTYYVLSTRESRELLAAVLSDYAGLPDGQTRDVNWDHPKSWAEFLDHIDGIELYGPEDRRDPTLASLAFNPTDTIDCLLWPAATDRIATERVNTVIATVAGYAAGQPLVHVTAVDTRPDRTLIRLVATRPLLEELLSNVDVERVRAPLRAVITLGDIVTSAMPDHTPDPAQTPIGVIDGVINTLNPLTGPHIQHIQGFPRGHTFAAADAHGTAVAGNAVWGDLDPLITNATLPTPHPIISARVLDLDPSGDYAVTGLAHLIIEEAIRWLAAEHSIRVINLSINQPVPASGALRDELTVTIDTLARELDVVIVVSTGNRTHLAVGDWLSSYPAYLNDPEAKIAAPGDAALAVTVGSHAQRDVPGGLHAAAKVAIAATGQPSPFTRTGPTRGISRAGTLKPEFTHHGGNWSWNHLSGSVDAREPGTAAVVAISPQAGRIVGSNSGTSFAAPAVAHEIAQIGERYSAAGANLLRALTALSARVVHTTAGINPAHVSGYGRPDATRVLESVPNRVFLTFEGSMPTNRVVVHRLPVPAEFADGVRQRTFRVALAFDPPVRRNRREYIAGTMAAELVRGITLNDVQEIYARQPGLAAVADDPTLIRLDLPDEEHRPNMYPGATTIASNTLIRREFLNGRWDPDHGDYFLIITHNQSAWTTAQRNSYPNQTYALAVEIAEEGASTLDLYAAIRAQLRARARVR